MILTDDKGNKFEFDPIEEDLDVGRLKPLPHFGNEYWFIDEYGIVDSYYWSGDSCDEKMKEFGNYFRTEKEAEIARDKIKALLQGLK